LPNPRFEDRIWRSGRSVKKSGENLVTLTNLQLITYFLGGPMARVAVFAGLVVDEANNAVDVVYVGAEPHYVIDDGGFLRHIPTEKVDRQVLSVMQEGVLENREAVVDGMLKYMGKDDLFTKAAVEASIGQMHENVGTLLNVGLPEDARRWLGLMGLRIVVDFHGEVVDVEMPGSIELDE
jgi:hypothetical protein